ncbi:MAG: phosphoenolpyruvate carboxylase [Candidatus Caldarchaeum sp.]|uniref:Phosphoenolpyruvate carboxylase n=2 Tax=Caldiarchaeum subterraneum TaxID=311458 RepID=A0A7C4E2H4_CALS0
MVDEERHIPRTMSSQHPDNVYSPPWLDTPLIEGDDEVEEVYQSWVTLGCEEAMWDAEGKDVDLNVVRKLLTTHPEHFREKIIGRDHFLTYRIPNPSMEKSDKKVFFETLQSIPKHFDACTAFYGRQVNPPVFEVILPFTTSVNQLIRVVNTYRKAVVQLEEIVIDYPNVTLGDIIGKISPEKIEVIPLFEDLDSMLNADAILGRFIELTSPRYVRAFIARSDPALNNGLVAATLMAKLALDKLQHLSKNTGIPVHTIIGVGTLPFRGGLSPTYLEKFYEEYGGVSTVTIQSAFRYDYPQNQVKEAIKSINKTLPIKKRSTMVENVESVLQVIAKASQAYRAFAEVAAPSIARISALTPMRRRRKLHVGAFAYSRMVGGVELPRAIPYACSFYTLGLPPEFIGLRFLYQLSEEEFDVLKQFYNLAEDLRRVAPLVCFDNINLLLSEESKDRHELQPLREALPLYVEDLEAAQDILNIKPGPKTPSERKYSNILNNFLISYMEGNLEEARQELLRAAGFRRCLG